MPRSADVLQPIGREAKGQSETLKIVGLVYSPENRQKIAAWSEGKRILIIDANGVLFNSDKDDVQVNPRAQKTLDKLKGLGYTLILWSDAPLQFNTHLARAGLDKYFPLKIYRENYRLDDETREQYETAVREAPWLKGSDLDTILSLSGNDIQKYFFAIFRKCCIVDDQMSPENFAPLRFIKNCESYYHIIEVSSFGESRKPHRPSFFSPRLIRDIITSFPPPTT